MIDWFRERQEIWRTPPKKPKVSSAAEKFLPFDKRALRLYRRGFWLAPSWLFIDTARCYRMDGKDEEERSEILEKQKTATAWYVVIWFLALVAILFLAPADGTLAKIAAGVALYRLIEIALTVLGFVLDQREPQIARSLITIGILGLQMALIFAIVYNAFAHNDFWLPGVTHPVHGTAPAAASPLEYLYLSWTYMITIGNSYTPATELARYLQIAATSSGIVLLGIVAARAIGLVDNTDETVSELSDELGAMKTETARLKEEIDKRLPE